MNETKGHIVVVDDDQEMVSLIADFLMSSQYQVSPFSKATEAVHYIKALEAKKKYVDLVISDINMPELSGIDLINNIHRTQPGLPMILITAFGSVDSAVDAIRAGAFDYVVKPFQLAELNVSVDRALRYRKLQKENKSLRSEIKKNWSYGNIIGKNPKMKEIIELIPRIASAVTNVMITGESGTGKEIIAKSIHDSGNRSKKPFIPINCSSIPDQLLESELFGHMKGSFTGAHQNKKGLFLEANGGTLFLDEIGDMDIGLQAKLLRVIQERKIKPVGSNEFIDFDVRILAATHKDLKLLCKQGKFREDLYYRLSVLPVSIPPLRERKDDIPELAAHFLEKYAAINASPCRSFSKEAMEALILSPWEGNVRELENVIERAVVLCPDEQIPAKHVTSSSAFGTRGTSNKEDSDFKPVHDAQNFSETMPSLEDLERRYIKAVLDYTKDRKEKAAKILGINRRTLYRKERVYGFVSDEDESSLQ